jgi:glycosyltransferase involved in cell wall biosynthesis
MQIGVVALALLSGYAVFIVLTSAAALSGFRMFKPLVHITSGSGHKVSIIVAAKNEADTLRESLASLAQLEYPAEVIVVCGPSDDGTEEVAREFASKVTVLTEPERPVDWLGKSWACHHGYLRSTGDILLFTDGDVLHSRESLAAALANLESDRADLLSVWPEVVTRTASERVVLQASVFFLCVGVAAVSARRTSRGTRVNGANGQYIMITREAYAAIGGHEAIKTDIMEDSAMGRRALRHGLEVINANGEGYLKVKPYSGFGETWEAHERFGAGLVPSWGELAAAFALTVAYFVGPFALLGGALATMNGGFILVAGLMCALVYAAQAFFSLKVSRVQYFLLAPLSGLLVIAAFVTGFLRFRRGGITWKGVKYASDRFKPL